MKWQKYKKTGSCHALIVTGCMAQRYQKEIIEEVPEVDAVLGTTSYGDIVKALEEAVAEIISKNSVILIICRIQEANVSLQQVDISAT